MSNAAVVDIVVPELEYTGTLCVLDPSGDTRMQWDKNDPAQVEAARKRFDEMRAKGYMAYSVSRSGRQDTVLHAFDPDAERVIMQKPHVGG